MKFPKELCEIRKKFCRQNCSSQEDLQIDYRPFLDRTRSFRFNRKKRFSRSENGFSLQNT